jgi:hypothetical protein
MPNTPILQLPYPASTDTADVPRDVQALAVKLDAVVPAQAGKTAVVSSLVGDVGLVGQVRAGRQLAASDFTTLGLSAPRGLWNLSDLTDASGNARNLTNKGGVSFSPGINGLSATAAQFSGSTSQALYIADTGAADPFRIGTGSWGCWFRTAKRGVSQTVVSKWGTAGLFILYVNSTNAAATGITTDGNPAGGNVFLAGGVSDVADDRWHFAVGTTDGTQVRLYVDGTLESALSAGVMYTATAPALNVGANAADAGTAAGSPHYGRVDEAFVTADVLTEDQVRSLYAARLVHTLGAQPKTVSLSVRRQRRGAALATTDFSTGPLRLYNLTAGSLADQGSNNTPVVYISGGAGAIAGADGVYQNALGFSAGQVGATDAGLPSALLARSYGCWFKTTTLGGGSSALLAWGTITTADTRAFIVSQGQIYAASAADNIIGPYVVDGQWHFLAVTEDNAAGDGVRRKMYLDGRLVGGSTVLSSTTLAGANRFRIGASSDGTNPFTGQIDGAFVTGYAMTTDEVLRLYAKASQTMPASPKNSGDHVEGYDSGSVLVVADTLDAQHYIDLTLA